MKDELIALYYQLSGCCNKTQHKSLERILKAKNINKQNKLEVISVSKHLTRLWREYLLQKYQIISRIINNIKKLFFFLCIYKMANITRERDVTPMVYK